MRNSFIGSTGQIYWIHNAEASQGSRHLKLVESIGFIFVKVSERAFKLFQLCWCEIGHVAGYDLHVRSGQPDEGGKECSNLIIEERNLL